MSLPVLGDLYISVVGSHPISLLQRRSAMVRIVPGACFGFLGSRGVRLRSGLIPCQLVPALVVFSRKLRAEISTWGICGAKTIGMVQLK